MRESNRELIYDTIKGTDTFDLHTLDRQVYQTSDCKTVDGIVRLLKSGYVEGVDISKSSSGPLPLRVEFIFTEKATKFAKEEFFDHFV